MWWASTERTWDEQTKYPGTLSAHFAIDPSAFSGLNVLDIGCGPAGTLEFAKSAALRVGLDPLARSYRQFGSGTHEMQYVAANAEATPFSDNSFDVVLSFNSLDHVDRIEPVIAEIQRIIRPGGKFIFYSDIHSTPTECEPQFFSWDFLQSFTPFTIEFEQHKDKETYEPFDHSNTTDRCGTLYAILQKPTDLGVSK